MAAALGRPAPNKLRPLVPVDGGDAEIAPSFGTLTIRTLAEVDVIVARGDAPQRYEVRYRQRDEDDPSETTTVSVTAERVLREAPCAVLVVPATPQ